MPKSTLRTDEDFEAFYKKHRQFVFRLCLSYMKDHAEAEDIAEDVFVKVLQGKTIFTDDEHERKWLCVTSINMCKNRLKSWKRTRVSPIDEIDEISVYENFGEESDLLGVIRKLPEKYKDVILLYYYQGYKTDEIAKMLKRPPSTVRGQIRDARNLLKEILGGDL